MTPTVGYCPHPMTDPRRFGVVSYSDSAPWGVQVGYRTPRPRSETVVLLLHGVAGDSASWTPLLTELAQYRPLPDLILADLPGFGSSENRLSSLAAADVGAYLLDLVTRCGWRRVHLVGHSMGGFLALDMAGRADPRIVSVGSISGAYVSIIRTVNHPLAAWRSEPRSALTYAALRLLASTGRMGAAAARAVADTPVAPMLLTGLAASPRGLQPSVRRSLLRNLRPRSFVLAARNGRGYDIAARWRGIEVPTVGLFGHDDRLVPREDADALADTLPAAEVRIIMGAAHLAHLERPQDVATLLHLPSQ